MESNSAQHLDTTEDLNTAFDCFLPKTVEEAVDRLISELPPQDKDLIADMHKDEVRFLSATILGVHMQNKFGLGLGNEALMASCCSAVRANQLHFFDAATVIIEKLWKKLGETPALRIVD